LCPLGTVPKVSLEIDYFGDIIKIVILIDRSDSLSENCVISVIKNVTNILSIININIINIFEFTEHPLTFTP